VFLVKNVMNNIDLIPSGLQKKFWLVSADMGYGHQRAIYPLKALSVNDKILNSNTSPNSTAKERRLWKEVLGIYEFLSRGGTVPLFGNFINNMMDKLLYIPKYYPLKEVPKPTLQVRYLKFCIKRGLCNGVNNDMKSHDLPIITSFYSTAIAAEMAGHNIVYCIICDTDISRVWVPEDASESRIIYFATGTESSYRLRSYGVPGKNIQLTGFPLPIELLGDRSLNILRHNLTRRLRKLDPNRVFHNRYKHSVNAFLGNGDIGISAELNVEPITVTYAVGGAGAQKEIGRKIAQSLAKEIINNRVILNLVAGKRVELKEYFLNVKNEITDNNINVRIIWGENNEEYFDLFNECLQTTDLLWTKPSELSFYCALGIPIILTPSIGPQERFNRRWLRETGAGFKQQDPEYTHQWLFDMLSRCRFAEAAWLGFLKARKYGTYNILDFLDKGTFTASNDPLKR
jgi:hypothetical protein